MVKKYGFRVGKDGKCTGNVYTKVFAFVLYSARKETNGDNQTEEGEQ